MDKTTALIVIDLQEAMRAERTSDWPWANDDAPEVAGKLLAAFRAQGLPVIHIHHNTDYPGDGFHPDSPLVVAMAEVTPTEAEPLVVKTGSSGFIGTGLEAMLRSSGINRLVIVGGEANMCVESTTRMAGNLGFDTTVVADALVAFPRTLRDGRVMPPQAVLDMALANLRSFATIKDAVEVLVEVAAQA